MSMQSRSLMDDMTALLQQGNSPVWLRWEMEFRLYQGYRHRNACFLCATAVHDGVLYGHPYRGQQVRHLLPDWDRNFSEDDLVALLDFERPLHEEDFPPDDAENVCIVSEQDVPLVTKMRLPSENIERVKCDWFDEVGDGHLEILCNPIYCGGNVLREDHRVSLWNALRRLGARRRDFQSRVVEDIIDPNWMPHRFPRTAGDDMQHHIDVLRRNWKTRFPDKQFVEFDEHTEQFDPKNDVFVRRVYSDFFYAGDEREKALAAIAKHPALFEFDEIPHALAIRESYAWIPCNVDVFADGSCHIDGHINGLPRDDRDAEEIYQGFERVLSEMLPAFQALNAAPAKGTAGRMQVVCKAQCYHLDEPNQTYKGFWHTEGCTENIVAAGVYYVHVSSGIIGGDVKFRQRFGAVEDTFVQAAENSCVVFANSMPHRVRIMKSIDEGQSRMFINFFVVDPNQPLPTDCNFVSRLTLSRILVQYVRETLGKILPVDVVGLILRYIPGMWTSEAEAKAFRNKARAAMKATRSGPGWMTIQFGNCGVMSFVEDTELMGKKGMEYNLELHHTSSSDAYESQ